MFLRLSLITFLIRRLLFGRGVFFRDANLTGWIDPFYLNLKFHAAEKMPLINFNLPKVTGKFYAKHRPVRRRRWREGRGGGREGGQNGGQVLSSIQMPA